MRVAPHMRSTLASVSRVAGENVSRAAEPVERAARALGHAAAAPVERAIEEVRHHKRPWLFSRRFWRSSTGKELLFYLAVVAAVAIAVGYMSVYAAEQSVGTALEAQLAATSARMASTETAFLATAATVNQLNGRAVARNETGLHEGDDAYLLAQLDVYEQLFSVAVAWDESGSVLSAWRCGGDGELCVAEVAAADGCLRTYATAATANGTARTLPALSENCTYAAEAWTTGNFSSPYLGAGGSLLTRGSQRALDGYPAAVSVEVDLRVLRDGFDGLVLGTQGEWAIVDADETIVLSSADALSAAGQVQLRDSSSAVLRATQARLSAAGYRERRAGAGAVFTSGDALSSTVVGFHRVHGGQWVAVFGVPKEDYFGFLAPGVAATVLVSSLSAALLVYVVYTDRFGGLRTRKRDPKQLFWMALKRSRSVKLDRIDNVTDDVDYSAYSIAGIILGMAALLCVGWQMQITTAVTAVAREVAEQVQDLSVSELHQVVETYDDVALQIQTEIARKDGAFVTFGDPVASSTLPPEVAGCQSEMPADLIQFFSDLVAAYEAHPHAVESAGVVFDNGCAFLAHEQDEFLLSDATTAVLGVGALVAYPSGEVRASPAAFREEQWWQMAHALPEPLLSPAWTAVHAFEELLPGAWGQALVFRFGDGVVGMGMSLDFISAQLSDKLSDDALGLDSAYGFVTEVGGDPERPLDLLVGATQADTATPSGRLAANASAHAGVAATAAQLNQMMSDQGMDLRAAGAQFEYEQEVRFGLDRTWARVVVFDDVYDLRWLLVVAVERSFIDADIQNWNAVSILVAAGLVTGALYVIRAMHLLTGIERRGVHEELHDARYWRRVAQALAKDVAAAGAGVQAGSSKFERARAYVSDSYRVSDRHVLDSLRVQTRNDPEARVPLMALYRMYTSPWYRRLVELVIVLHCCVCFFEAPERDPVAPIGEYPRALLFVQGACLAVHVGDQLLCVHLFGLHVRGTRAASSAKRLSKRLLFRCVLVAALAADLVLLVSTRYTAASLVSYSYSWVQTHLPYSAALRPLLLVSRNHEILLSLNNFAITLLLAKDVLVVGASFLMVATAGAVTLLSEICYTEDLGRNVSDWRSAVVVMFVFIFTGENYPVVVHPAILTDDCPAARSIYRAYFVALSFVGMFLITSLILGTFQASYSKRLREIKLRQDKEHRLSIIVAFLVLTYEEARNSTTGDTRLTVAPDEFRPFFAHCGVTPDTKARSHAVLAISRRLEILSFVDIVETLMADHANRGALFLDPNGSTETYHRWSAWLGGLAHALPSLARARRALRVVKDSPHYDHVVLALVLVNLWAMCLVGTNVARTALRYLGPVFVFINALETLLRIVTYGPWTFLFKFHPDDPLRRPAHQFDFLVSGVTAAAFVYTRASLGAYSVSVTTAEQVVLAMPCLRLFTIVKTNKRLIFGLLTVLKGFWALLALLFITVFWFAILATFLFAGLFHYMPADVYDMPQANFNSVVESLTTGFQLMLGESWDAVMLAAMDSSFGYAAAGFFCLYILLLGILFTQLFISVVVDGYDRLNKMLESTSGLAAAPGTSLLAVAAFAEAAEQHRKRAASLVDSAAAAGGKKQASSSSSSGARDRDRDRDVSHSAALVAATAATHARRLKHHRRHEEVESPLARDLVPTPTSARSAVAAAAGSGSGSGSGSGRGVCDVVCIDLSTEEPEAVAALDAETVPGGVHLWVFRPGSVDDDSAAASGSAVLDKDSSLQALARGAERRLYGDRAEIFHFVPGCKVATLAWHIGMAAHVAADVRVRVLTQDTAGLQPLLGLCSAGCHISLFDHMDALLFTLSKFRRPSSKLPPIASSSSSGRAHRETLRE